MSISTGRSFNNEVYTIVNLWNCSGILKCNQFDIVGWPSDYVRIHQGPGLTIFQCFLLNEMWELPEHCLCLASGDSKASAIESKDSMTLSGSTTFRGSSLSFLFLKGNHQCSSSPSDWLLRTVRYSEKYQGRHSRFHVIGEAIRGFISRCIWIQKLSKFA